jgi:hypothetical protein
LIDTYGTGNFGGFLYVYTPFAPNEYLNLYYALDTLHQANRQMARREETQWTAVHPFRLYPELEGLLPWGCTKNYGDAFFWQVQGSPDIWETVFYDLRRGEYEVWKKTTSELLLHLFTRQAESVLLPDDFPPENDEMVFHPE